MGYWIPSSTKERISMMLLSLFLFQRLSLIG